MSFFESVIATKVVLINPIDNIKYFPTVYKRDELTIFLSSNTNCNRRYKYSLNYLDFYTSHM